MFPRDRPHARDVLSLVDKYTSGSPDRKTTCQMTSQKWGVFCDGFSCSYLQGGRRQTSPQFSEGCQYRGRKLARGSMYCLCSPRNVIGRIYWFSDKFCKGFSHSQVHSCGGGVHRMVEDCYSWTLYSLITNNSKIHAKGIEKKTPIQLEWKTT